MGGCSAKRRPGGYGASATENRRRRKGVVAERAPEHIRVQVAGRCEFQSMYKWHGGSRSLHARECGIDKYH